MITTCDLTCTYRDFTALDRLTLTVAEGEIFGYIGPNGAGKSTTIRILSGLLKATSGTAQIGGLDVLKNPAGARALVGYMPEAFGVYTGMRVWEYLDFFGAVYRLPARRRKQRVEEVLDITGTTVMRDYIITTLSRGMHQRLGLARALIHDPRVLFLDEPASGLDPRARVEFRQLLKDLKARGKTIMVSSHILPELAEVCDRIGILEQGRLLLCDRVSQVCHQVTTRRVIELEVLSSVEAAQQVLRSPELSGDVVVEETIDKLIRLSINSESQHAAALLQTLMERGVQVLWFREQARDLEDVFMHVTRSAAAGTRRTGDVD